jgi:hypothetical protein
MPSNGLITTAKINGAGGPVSAEVIFGFANVGVYRMFLWDAARTPTQIAFGDNVDKEPDLHQLPVAAADLPTHQLSYETQIESPSSSDGQMFSLFILIRQDGKIVPNGSIERSGALPDTLNKSVIGFVKFEVA